MYIKILFRSLFKRRKHNLIKIISLSAGLAMGLVLIAKVYFEQSYNNFFQDNERIYRIIYLQDKGTETYEMVPGGVAIGMKDELPEVEFATRYTWIDRNAILVTSDRNRYYGKMIMGDTCLFDVFPRRILAGDVKDVLSRPMYVMISDKIAEKMGGISSVIGKTFESQTKPGKIFTIGGVFESLPNNTHLKYDIVISMASVGNVLWEGSSINWTGNDRYFAYVKLYPGIETENLKEEVEKMRNKYLPMEELEKAGVEIDYDFVPLNKIHTGDETTKQTMWILSILAISLLFTAVMNYVLVAISLLVSRSKEMAINKCYGASEKNIYYRMLLETGVDIFISLAIATLLILFLRGAILSLLGTTLSDLFTTNSVMLLLAVCFLVFIITAIIPGYLFSRIPVAVAFRKYSESKRLWKLGLLFTQFTSAAFFVALLFIVNRQYSFMINDNTGYNYDNIAYCDLSGVNEELRQKAVDELKSMPEVAEVTSCDNLLFNGAAGNNILLPNDDRELFNIADLHSVGDNYLSIMNIPVVEGRSFIEKISSSREVMVSRSFIDNIMKFTDWHDGVVGKEIFITGQGSSSVDFFKICGVYEEVRLGVIGAQDTRPTVMFYSDKPSEFLIVKYHKETSEAIIKTTDLLQNMLPDIEVVVNSYTGEIINQYRGSMNFRNSVMVAGLATLVISLMGLIGYTNDETNRRKKETAIRKVNGAKMVDIQRMFLKDINYMALPAITIGCVIAYFVANRWLERFSEKADLTVPLFAGCAFAILFIILATVGIRSYYAANENPAESIKSD